MNFINKRSLRSLLLAVVLVTIVWASWGHLSGHMSVAGMRALVESHPRYGRLLFMAMIVAGIFTHVPMAGTVVIALGAVVFGPFDAFVYGWAAALAGTTSTFLLVRYIARDYLQHMLSTLSTRLRALDDRLTRNGFLTVLALRVVLGLAPVLDWGLGLTGVLTRDYIAGTALGVVPNIAVAVLFANIIANRRPGSGMLFLKVAIIGAALVIVVAAILHAARRRPKSID
jgi:uncharacterized membrane protein YdjX (TVP38/TMEM64 family)